MLLTSACEHGRSNALYVSGGGRPLQPPAVLNIIFRFTDDELLGTKSLGQECDVSSRRGFRFPYFSASRSANFYADLSTKKPRQRFYSRGPW